MYIPMSDVDVGPQDSVKLKLHQDSYRTRHNPPPFQCALGMINEYST